MFTGDLGCSQGGSDSDLGLDNSQGHEAWDGGVDNSVECNDYLPLWLEHVERTRVFVFVVKSCLWNPQCKFAHLEALCCRTPEHCFMKLVPMSCLKMWSLWSTTVRWEWVLPKIERVDCQLEMWLSTLEKPLGQRPLWNQQRQMVFGRRLSNFVCSLHMQ